MTDLTETMARAMWDRMVGYRRIAWDQLDVEDQDVFRAYARAAHAAIEAAGYRVVPVEPTEAMRAAFNTPMLDMPLGNGQSVKVHGFTHYAEGVWKDMLAAAPKVTE